MAITALIFDFDGTLAELNLDFHILSRELEQLARQAGLSGPWPGGFLLEAIETVAARLPGGFASQALGHLQRRELEAADQGRLFPFSRALLARARAQGMGTAIISRNCAAAIRRVFPQVEDLCDHFLPREAVTRPKPHPEHVAAALRGLGVAPDQAALVGDHPLDLTAAQEAGCLGVGVASGRISAAELAAAGAHLVLPDASGLLEALQKGPGLARRRA